MYIQSCNYYDCTILLIVFILLYSLYMFCICFSIMWNVKYENKFKFKFKFIWFLALMSIRVQFSWEKKQEDLMLTQIDESWLLWKITSQNLNIQWKIKRLSFFFWQFSLFSDTSPMDLSAPAESALTTIITSEMCPDQAADGGGQTEGWCSIVFTCPMSWSCF